MSDVLLELTPEQLRAAKLGALKGARRSTTEYNEIVVKRLAASLDEGFTEKAQKAEGESLRLFIKEEDAGVLVETIADYAAYRREKGEDASADKYQSVSNDINNQLAQRGVLLQ